MTPRRTWLSPLLISLLVPGCAHPLPPCGALPPTPQLDRTPLAADDFVHLVPLGNLNPPGHTLPTDHVYLTLPLETRAGVRVPAIVPVVSPGQVRLARVERRDWTAGPRAGQSEYKLVVQACAEVSFELDHLLALAPGLAERVGVTDRDCEPARAGAESRRCRLSTELVLRPGELIGYGGGAGQYALDLGAHDTRVAELRFANQERHVAGARAKDDLHVVCPADYFTAAPRELLLSRAGGFDPEEQRSAEPRCGGFAQDLPGTAQGVWYLRGHEPRDGDGDESQHLALVHDNVAPELGALSAGISLPGLGGVHTFTAMHDGYVNRDFGGVFASGHVYCYDRLSDAHGQVALLEMLNATTLRIEARAAAECGEGPWRLDEKAVEFVR